MNNDIRDAIVVGAGMGGTAYVYTRKGFSFPMGPLGFGSPELIKSILKEIGSSYELTTRAVRYKVHALA